MRYLYRPFLAFLLALGLAASAAGTELPEQVVVEDRNGSQRLIKTFVVSPQTDPDSLREDPFLYEGRNYTWAYTTKEEHTALDVKSVTETVTVETQDDDLASILMELDSVLPYDQDGYTGELILDHTTLDIQAAGHEERYGTLTDIQVFSDLPGNDAGQIPASTERDGATLPLVHVEWQEEAPSEEAPAVPRYQAVAIYAATTSYSGATGYLTTAQYSGQVTNSGVDSVTYTVVYTGQPAEPAAEPGVPFSFSLLPVPSIVLASVPLAAALMSLVLVCLRRRTNVRVYIPSGRPRDWRLIARFRTDAAHPSIDLRTVEPCPDGMVAVELRPRLARRLANQTFTVRWTQGEHRYTVRGGRAGDWHTFRIDQEDDPAHETHDPPQKS